ncbi:hypothetical protein BKA63DRAFT_282621 [Paraphoma chrysanthemicola]|nr:hypothetical protein BKA63DRAFT_282621 [Paraphoma chrysanthemicola]
MSAAAPAPKQQLKLKLRQSPGSDPNTPAARSSATPSIIVDNEALLRQQRHVQNSMHTSRTPRPSSQGKSGTPASSNPFTGPKGAATGIAPLSAAQPKTAGSPPAVNGVKQDVQSPALSAIRPASTASDSQRLSVPAQTPHAVMAPPRPTSGSPFPSGPIGQQPVQTNGYHPSPSYPIPSTALRHDTFRKEPLKSE